MAARWPQIVGFEALIDKRSAVDAEARWRIDQSDGLAFRPVRPVPHEDGTVTEVARASWLEIDLPIVQVHDTTTQPGRIRAWGLHQRSTDRLFVVSGHVSIVVYDGRRDSPTVGALNEFKVSDRNSGLLVVAPGLYHACRAPSETGTLDPETDLVARVAEGARPPVHCPPADEREAARFDASRRVPHPPELRAGPMARHRAGPEDPDRGPPGKRPAGK